MLSMDERRFAVRHSRLCCFSTSASCLVRLARDSGLNPWTIGVCVQESDHTESNDKILTVGRMIKNPSLCLRLDHHGHRFGS